jgi:hypothetical protein
MGNQLATFAFTRQLRTLLAKNVGQLGGDKIGRIGTHSLPGGLAVQGLAGNGGFLLDLAGCSTSNISPISSWSSMDGSAKPLSPLLLLLLLLLLLDFLCEPFFHAFFAFFSSLYGSLKPL